MSGMINKTHALEPTVAVQIAGAYVDGDVVGGLLDLSDLCGGGGGGTIRQVVLVDDDSEGAIFDLYLFDGKPTVIVDADPFAGSIADTDLLKLVGKLALSTLVTLNSNDYYLETEVNLSHGTGELWGYLVLNGSTPTYTATDDLALKITGWMD